MSPQTYDIQELVGASGVPRRTVYFYVQQGLLPPPSGDTRTFRCCSIPTQNERSFSDSATRASAVGRATCSAAGP